MSEIDPWKHADYIYACYLVVGFTVGLLILWIFRDERKQHQLLDELEKQAKTK
jgi:heme exporter protein CcmD